MPDDQIKTTQTVGSRLKIIKDAKVEWERVSLLILRLREDRKTEQEANQDNIRGTTAQNYGDDGRGNTTRGPSTDKKPGQAPKGLSKRLAGQYELPAKA